jgi:hypothetical protein
VELGVGDVDRQLLQHILKKDPKHSYFFLP